jgi:Uma2 family endonuclease
MTHDARAAHAYSPWYPSHSMLEISFESDSTVTPGEFEAWLSYRADSNDHYELLNGRIVMTPPAGYPHGYVELNIAFCLKLWVRETGLGRLLGSSQGFILPSGDIVEPDCSYVSNERWAVMPPAREGKFLEVVPDLVVETLSGATAKRDRTEKREIYERNGVREYWIVDAHERTVTVFVAEGGRFAEGREFASSARVTSSVMPGLDVEVEAFFR